MATSRDPQWWAGETPILIGDLPNHLPRKADGSKVSISTVWRWTLAGRRGVRLRRFHAGIQWATTIEELRRWQAALSEAVGVWGDSVHGAPPQAGTCGGA